MRAMVVEVGPEIEQLVFEICRRPEQDVIQVMLQIWSEIPASIAGVTRIA